MLPPPVYNPGCSPGVTPFRRENPISQTGAIGRFQPTAFPIGRQDKMFVCDPALFFRTGNACDRPWGTARRLGPGLPAWIARFV